MTAYIDEHRERFGVEPICTTLQFTAQGPWRSVADLELATLTWVHWWNTSRLLEPIGHIPPIEHENNWKNHQGGETRTAIDTIPNQVT